MKPVYEHCLHMNNFIKIITSIKQIYFNFIINFIEQF